MPVLKPLPVAPLTPDDDEIWKIVLAGMDTKYFVLQRIWDTALRSDRRDAELMLRLTQTGAMSPPNDRAVCHSLLSFGFEPSQWP